MRNQLQEQVKKAFCYQMLFWSFTVSINCSWDLNFFANSRPTASNFKSFSWSPEWFFLTVCQNNFGNKIPMSMFLKFFCKILRGVQKLCWPNFSHYYIDPLSISGWHFFTIIRENLHIVDISTYLPHFVNVIKNAPLAVPISNFNRTARIHRKLWFLHLTYVGT